MAIRPRPALKWMMSLSLLILLATRVQAQVPYTGGSGDGYGRHQFFYLEGDPGGSIPTTVFPNVVPRGGTFTVLVGGVRNKLEIIVRTVQGQMLDRRVSWGITGNYQERMTAEGWAAGVYLIEVRTDGQAQRFKLIVVEE